MKKSTLEEFIIKAKIVHGEKYDYSKSKYIGGHIKMRIACHEHGQFFQSPSNHLSNHGCYECGVVASSEKRSLSLREFKIKANKIHGDKYNYDNVTYVNHKTKMNILCNKHGVFKMNPNSLLRGHGCPKCGLVSRTEKRRLSLKEFKAKAKSIHGNKYTYEKVVYVNSNTNVEVVCKNHGIFRTKPSNFLLGKGCMDCGREKSGWTKKGWKEKGETSSNFDGFKLYLLECKDKEESFLKVGRTFMKINKRYAKGKDMPYDFKAIYVLQEDSDYVYDLENEVKRSFPKYSPFKSFGGETECFPTSELNNIIKYIEENNVRHNFCNNNKEI